MIIMPRSETSRRFRRTAEAAVLLLLLAGCGGAAGDDGSGTPNASATATEATAPSGSGPASASSGPSPAGSGPAADARAPATGAEPTPSSSGSAANAAATPPAGTPIQDGMESSQPVSLTIEALGRHSAIIETGLREDRTLEVPPEGEGAPASWFNGSPTPGERGASVLLGHVNSLEDESGVFYNLDELEQGDSISVTRQDGTVANFAVYKTELYPKDEFPTKAVYSPTEGPELRLITCDGFTQSSGEFEKNLVVYAQFTGAG
ncbi:sortase domain-containing protein [Arthrobacter castelli]|uniref:sortase domain-containing protein n=1 Tax=Arthrobacter castelli TaxID=271431 RepID=UPI000411CFEF|nr:sortase [Arthrobacter castelli]